MVRMILKPLLGAAATLALSSSLSAAPINAIAYLSSGANVVDFEDVAGAAFPGVNVDGILATGGVTIAERFVGQTLGVNGDLDVLSGLPSGPLTLQVGAPGANVAIGTDTGTNGLYPYGPLGFPAANGYGEGSFAVLFPGLVSSFGIELFFGADTSSTFLDFFAADGSLIDAVTIMGIGTFGFARDGGAQDIAGVSIYTADAGGLGYDNLRYGDAITTAVPEPATLLLALLGFAGMLGVRRRANA